MMTMTIKNAKEQNVWENNWTKSGLFIGPNWKYWTTAIKYPVNKSKTAWVIFGKRFEKKMDPAPPLKTPSEISNHAR